MEHLFFQSQMDESTPLGGDQDLRTSTLIRQRPIRGDSNIDFLGESEGFPPPPPHDSFPDAGEAINDFWSMSGNFIYRHHVEPRVKLYSSREESFPIPLKYIDVSRTTHTNLDVKQEKRIDDYWNIDGSRDLSDYWTGFTQYILLEEKTSKRIYISHSNKCSTYLQDGCLNKMRSLDWKQLVGKNQSWKYLSLIGDERVINLQRTNVYVFSDSVLCLGKILDKPQSNDACEQRLGWLKSSQKYRNFDRIDGEPMEFEWNIFPRHNTLQLNEEVKRLLLRLDETPEKFHRKNHIYVAVQRHFLWIKRLKKSAWRMPNSFLYLERDLEKDNGHSLVLVLTRSGTVSVKTVNKECGTKWRRR